MKIKYIESKDKRVEIFNEFIKTAFPQFIIETKPDVLLVAGGDGALHHAIYQNSDFKGVFVGKAMGTLNFLMNSFDNDFEQLKALETEKIKLKVQSTETISVFRNGEFIGIAANDVIFGDSINGYHTYTLSTEDKSFTDFVVKGTGLCISTPLGSTAYNFNNGGPILPLESKMWSITGIACNKLIRDLLYSQSIKIRVNSSRLFLSGIDKGEINESDIIELKPGSDIKLGFLDDTSFMQKRVDFSHRFRKES